MAEEKLQEAKRSEKKILNNTTFEFDFEKNQLISHEMQPIS